MPTTKDSLQQDLAELLRQLIALKAGPKTMVGMKNLAASIDVHYQTFVRWPKGTRPIHAHKLALLCKALDDMTLLDWLERQVGRVAYVPAAITGEAGTKGALGVPGFIKKVGKALEALGDELATTRAARDKIQNVPSRLDDLIRECLRLKGWINKQHVGKRER